MGHLREREGEGQHGNVVLLSEGLSGGRNLLGGLSADLELFTGGLRSSGRGPAATPQILFGRPVMKCDVRRSAPSTDNAGPARNQLVVIEYLDVFNGSSRRASNHCRPGRSDCTESGARPVKAQDQDPPREEL